MTIFCVTFEAHYGPWLSDAQHCEESLGDHSDQSLHSCSDKMRWWGALGCLVVMGFAVVGSFVG